MSEQRDERRAYRIPDVNLPALEARIAALNKRATRLKLEPVKMLVLGREEVPLYEYPDGALWEAPNRPGDEPVGVRLYYLLEIDGQDPIIAGWRFIATLEHLLVDGVEKAVLRALPDQSIPPEYREAQATNCDHCRKKIQRRDTYLLREEASGDHKQVGSTCLRDFLGHGDPEAMAAYAELLASLGAFAEASEDADFGGGGGRISYLPAETYLSYVALAIRLKGWTSRRKAEEEGGYATATFATDLMFPRQGTPEHERHYHEACDRAEAMAGLEWARGLDQQGAELSDYEHNLNVLAGAGLLEWRDLGLAASMVAMYQRDRERRQQQAQGAGSEHLGAPKEKLELRATVTGAIPIDGNYGPCTLVRFLSGGNVLIWFATGEPELEVGDSYDVRATVKRHDEREGIKQTIITRAKLTAPCGAAA
ncbi:MAG TPA: hypothetical protein VM285_17565 [Polyangia bacterium]|nr:hypothetical protein [Polyangia bacterium]